MTSLLSSFFFLQEEEAVQTKEEIAKRKIKASSRQIGLAERKLQFDERTLQKEYAQAIALCKRAAKNGDSQSIVIGYAKSAVTAQKQRERCVRAKLLLQSSKSRILQVKSTSTLTAALKTSYLCLSLMNRCYPIAEFSAMMKQYEREKDKAEMMEEEVGNAFSMDEDDDEEEMEQLTDEVMQRVLDDVGLDLGAMMAAERVPSVNDFNKNFDRAWRKCDGDADALLTQLLSSSCSVPRQGPRGGGGS